MKTQTVTLEDIADIQMGFQSRSRLETSDSGRFCIIQGKDISKDNIINVACLARFDVEVNPERYLLQKDDVLFMSKGTYNYAACIEEHMRDTVASSSFYVLKLKTNRILPCFLAWWLNQPPAQDYFTQRQSSGATISFINSESLRKAPVQIPTLTKQQHIVNLNNLSNRYKQLNAQMMERIELLISKVMLNAMQQEEKA